MKSIKHKSKHKYIQSYQVDLYEDLNAFHVIQMLIPNDMGVKFF